LEFLILNRNEGNIKLKRLERKRDKRRGKREKRRGKREKRRGKREKEGE
jgi:hypothetical protein